ncbi:MAG: RNA methyltransferase [Bacteroidales bacterium]|nr:RNA methyltransferase [Bacteroidales bacterium]
MLTQISSVKNPLIKQIATYQAKSKERKADNVVLIEGKKELELAVSANIVFTKILFCPSIISYEELCTNVGNQIKTADIYEVSEEVFSKISYRETTGGIYIIGKVSEKKLSDLEVRDNSLFIILEAVEKPGNLGAICRIGDAAKVDGIIICDPHTDIYNPNSVRSSLGCVFSNNVVSTDYESAIKWLRENKITSYAAELRASEFYHKYDYRGKTALVFGTEATGLTEKWISNADHRIKIPMLGVIDSLNVSTSVSAMVFEVLRQRNFYMK